MIAFYIVTFCWMVTMTAWQVREAQHAKERMETLKLFRAHSLADFAAQVTPEAKRQGNYLKSAIQRAYADRRQQAVDDDED